MGTFLLASDGTSIPVIRRNPEAPAENGVTVVMAHGITSEKTEEGLFDELAERLVKIGCTTFQFDYRGHGDSPMPPQEMSLAGEILDLETVLEEAVKTGPIIIIASSFATVSVCQLTRAWKRRISGLVLLNPVLSVQKTFTHPELPWQQRNFGNERIASAFRTGQLLIEDRFPVSSAFLGELDGLEPAARITEFMCPMMLIHGDRDTFTSYDESRRVAATLGAKCRFVTVPGSEHGFHRPEDTDRVINSVTLFLHSLQ